MTKRKGGNAVNAKWKCIVAGGLAGAANGLFGAGGGLALVPLLINWVGLEEKKAFATSVAIILPLSVVSYTIFCLRGGSVWGEALPYLCGGIIGGLLSAKFFKKIPAVWLHRLFGALILYGGVKAVMLW
ncbi:MAG: sulfite exporter TauE/SafE family protein [Clostridia bacterium]|nr:sulfite exporter TauE/SafE family protein [Clostridia bacterium]